MLPTLQKLRILNTRPKDQAKPLTQAIQNAGGIVIECPTLEIQSTDKWINHLPDLKSIKLAIFISTNAVHFFFEKNIQWPETIQVIAIGQATAKALEKYKIKVTELPKRSDSEHLLRLKPLQSLQYKKVILVKGLGGRTLIQDFLKQQDANTTILEVYQRKYPQIQPQLIQSIWRNDQVDIILVTSEESLNNLFKMFGEEARLWLQSKTCLVISDRLAKAAFALGFQDIKISQPDNILDTLLRMNSCKTMKKHP